MRKRLQIALMATTVAATSISLSPPLRALDGDGPSEKITASDEHGRKIYVNDSVPARSSRRAERSDTPQRKLMYWSSKDNRWKPVPSGNAAAMRAARSAAAEVSDFLGRGAKQSAAAKNVEGHFHVTAAPAGHNAAPIAQTAADTNGDPQ